MAATTIISLTNGFADGTTRKLELGPFAQNAAAVTNVKTNIANVNANVADIENYYLSEGGAKFTGISFASLITTSETEINLNV